MAESGGFLNRLIKILLFTSALSLFASGLFAPIYAVFVEEINGSILDAGVAWFIASVAFASLQYPMGKLADIYSKKFFLLVQCFGTALVFFSMMFISSVEELFVLEFFIGVFQAVGTPAYDGLFSVNIDRNRESQEWGTWEMVSGYSSAFSALVGASVVYLFGFKTLFLFMGLLALAAGAVTFAFVKNDGVNPLKMKGAFLRKFFRKKAGR